MMLHNVGDDAGTGNFAGAAQDTGVTLSEIRRIGVLTSGGDAPGMNAAVRAVTRSAAVRGIEVVGIRKGYNGLIEDDMVPLSSENVSGILHTGGTMLQTARSEEFRTVAGRVRAADTIRRQMLDAVIVIGGDGSFTGATVLSQEHDVACIGIPATIDNDIFGTDYTIGYETALNTVIEAVDKIRDTAVSHGRIFFVEVMGHEAGMLALSSGVACGAEVILIPESREQHEELRKFVTCGYRQKHTSGIVIVAEGDEPGGAMKIAEEVRKEHPQLEVRVSILGHIQRGGSPVARDRINATRLGVGAVEALLAGKRNVMIGLQNDVLVPVPFAMAVKEFQGLDRELLRVHGQLTGLGECD